MTRYSHIADLWREGESRGRFVCSCEYCTCRDMGGRKEVKTEIRTQCLYSIILLCEVL